jgi:16S rRNA (guanine966-N2)-methyltransferase
MTRIIGGVAGGRRIITPRGQSTRPTSDRVREALFSSMEAWCGSLTGLRFLDLYAGSGAVGLEARSRGAGIVTLVEHDRRNAMLITKNMQVLGFTGVNLITRTVASALATPPTAPYDLVFLDPPYPMPDTDVEASIRALVTQRWVASGALVVVERATRGGGFAWPAGIEPVRDRRYGETMLWYGHPAEPHAGPRADREPSTP